MFQVVILVVGKTRQGFIQDGVAFYQKRVKPFINLTLKTIREEKEEKNLPAGLAKAREGERLLAQAPSKAYLAALDPQGREFTTEEFTAWLAKRGEDARPVAFLIGGHLGLSEEVLKKAHETLALSKLTLTHELARLVLLEQLYRSLTIKAGHPYHV